MSEPLNFLRHRQPCSRWLLRLVDYLPERLGDRLCDWLYPAEMEICFPPAGGTE